MKRTTLFSIGLSFLVLILGFVMMTGTVAAQRPGRATPAATRDRSGSSANRTPIATPDAQSTRQRPNTGTGGGAAGTPRATFSVPLNLTLTPRSTWTAPVSSDEAADIINSFASMYLGTNYNFSFAGAITGDANAPQWDAFVAKLPAELQNYINAFATAAGGSYWGVYKTGMGMTAIGDCTNNPNCTITKDDVNLYLTSASAGIYSGYVSGTAASAADALNLIHASYPALNNIALEAVASDQGYLFEAVTNGTGVNNKQVTASAQMYIAGVVKTGNQSLVYAIVSIGDGYVNMVK